MAVNYVFMHKLALLIPRNWPRGTSITYHPPPCRIDLPRVTMNTRPNHSLISPSTSQLLPPLRITSVPLPPRHHFPLHSPQYLPLPNLSLPPHLLPINPLTQPHHTPKIPMLPMSHNRSRPLIHRSRPIPTIPKPTLAHLGSLILNLKVRLHRGRLIGPDTKVYPVHYRLR